MIQGGMSLPRWVLVLAVVVGGGYLAYVLRAALTPLFFAFLIAYMLDPLIDRFEAQRVPRALAIGGILTVVLGAISGLIVIAMPIIARDLAEFTADLPGAIARLYVDLEAVVAGWGIAMPHSWSDAVTQLDLRFDDVAGAASPVGAVLGWLLGGTASLFAAAAGLMLIPVFAAYLLHDFDRITAGIRDLVPIYWRPHVVAVAREIDAVLGEFIRGQFIVMLILAAAYAVAYSLLGVRLAILIGLVAGLISFIPYLGGAVALGLAVVMCLIDWQGWWQVGGVVLAYSAIQIVEGFFVTPRIVGDKVGLPAVWVLLALLVGGELFGFLGVLLALPAAAVTKIFVVRLLRWYRSSDLFLAEGPPPGDSSMLSGVFRIDRVDP